MKDRSVSLPILQRYCLENGIPVPATAKREEIEAFITRAILHGRQVKPDVEHGCFGFWSEDDTNCTVCIYSEECAKVSLGMEAKRYRAFVKRLENPRFTTQVKAKSAKPRKNNRVARKNPSDSDR